MRQEDYAKDMAEKLNMALRNVQSQVIGLFRPQYYPNDMYLPVIANEDGMLTCIQVGTLLGLSNLTINVESGRYIKFPTINKYKDSTLSDMMKSPMEFDKWYRANVHDSSK